jgi:hypothetical protein
MPCEGDHGRSRLRPADPRHRLGWRATFYVSGMEHSPTSAPGTGWQRTPWHAAQRAAWALRKAETAAEKGNR